MPNAQGDRLLPVTHDEYRRRLHAQRMQEHRQFWNIVNEHDTPSPTSSIAQERACAAALEHYQALYALYYNTASAELSPWGPALPVPARPASIEKRPVRNIAPSGLFEDLFQLSAEESDTLDT